MPLTAEIRKTIQLQVSPTRFLDYKDYLKAVYRLCKQRLGRYSYLSFAEDLGFSRTNVVHLIIQGKRPLTLKAAKKIVKHLGITGNDRVYFEALVRYQNERDAKDREEIFRQLVAMKSRVLRTEDDRAQLEFFSEWYHPAIYEMTRLDDFRSDPKWICDRLQLRIRPEQARKSLQLLESLKLIQFDDERGRHVPTDLQVSTGDEVASVAVVRFHQKMIEMGKEAITRIATDARDISAITVSVSPAMAKQMKEEIRLFRKKLLAMADGTDAKDAVYQMNIQLFPLTKD